MKRENMIMRRWVCLVVKLLSPVIHNWLLRPPQEFASEMKPTYLVLDPTGLTFISPCT